MKREQAERREFLKKAGKVAVTAPAVAVLMSAGVKKAAADDIADTISGSAPPGGGDGRSD
ncbi:MAG: hypothetical protein H6907_20870 [Hyphomicrobiales bacterium]|nr:hypothetical protein [Hyphomicrobiales bacterium]MCP5374196.1 hypothetical protein [Hyphomicrobiales bacterium]